MLKTTKSDPRRTTKLQTIELHYANFADQLRWNHDRFTRLCSALGLTVHELGALVRLRMAETEKYLQRNSFPAPVELHLTLIERSIYPSPDAPIFPTI